MLRIWRTYGLVVLTLFWVEMALATGALQPTPDFSLAELDGNSVSLNALRGRNVLLVFGTTWCPHCDAALPILENLCATFGDEELEVVFVVIRQDAKEVAEFFGEPEPPYSILLDDSGIVSRRYGIKRIPTAVFVDQEGLIQYRGRLKEETVWLLMAGERPVGSEGFDDKVRASDRFAKSGDPNRPGTKRFIVELDEKPWFSKTLSETARNSRRAEFRRAAENIGGRIIHNYGKWKNRIVVEVPADRVQRLRELPRFKSFKEDRRVYALLEDSAYQIRADYAWDNAITGQGVKVCVVDTGIDYSHPDLQNKVVAQYDFTRGTEDAMDDHGHGTHCAGIIASEGMVYRGVSHDVALMAAKVLDYSGAGYASDVVLGINWCVAQEADVISLSLGEGLYSGTCDYDDMAQAVNAAVDAGVVVACAAGNDGNPNAMVAPACASKAIAVGAVDKIDSIASYSDGGSELDVVAPGGDLLGGTHYPEIVSAYSTEVANNPEYCLYLIADICWDDYFVVEGTRYIRLVGTSMAAPHVAGAAALLLEENPHLTPAQVKDVLEENADDLGAPGWDNIYGWGRVNVERALDNMPPEPVELNVNITEPNVTGTFTVGGEFVLSADVDCFGGDGCGDVLVHAQFCSGRDCNDFIDINTVTALSTMDENPNEIGVLSGYTVETGVPLIFDANTTFDISEEIYTRSMNVETAFIGSTSVTQHNTGDLEERDGIGAVGEDAEQLYEFEIPPGVVTRISIRMEHYLVFQWDEPESGWYIYTSNANGDQLHRVGDDCTPISGGGGEPPPPDCWFVSEGPAVLADLNPGGTNYIKLVSHDVGSSDILSFNDIEVIIEYALDPNNDDVHRYYVKFDISEVNATDEMTTARLNIYISQSAEGSVGDAYVVDNTLLPTDSAQLLHEVNDPCYSGLVNPIKSFSAESTGWMSLNVRAAVEEALAVGQTAIAFQIRERDCDQLFAVDANGSENRAYLTISQKVYTMSEGFTLSLPTGSVHTLSEPNSGPRTVTYDTIVVKDVSEANYVKYDNPSVAVIGSPVALEYSTGDLESRDGIGAIGEDAMEVYSFEIPPGVVSRIEVRLVHYMVIQWVDPDSGWYVYTSDANGNELHLVGDCIPPTGGGGQPPPPDCWFISEDPAVLADLNPGGTSYIKLVSHDVGDDGYGQDWLTFNDIEVIVEYEIDPNNDSISRYYVKFDISDIGPGAQIDSARLNVYVADPNADAVADISLVESTYDPCTGAYTIYNAEDASYSSLANPIKSFACDAVGFKQANVKPALEDAVESGVGEIAFLITERDENALFSIAPGNSPNPPFLNVYFKSGSNSGTARWNILPNTYGEFKLRVLAINNVGIMGVSDAMVINVLDPNLPVINNIDCLINSTWQDCTEAQYGDTLEKIRIDADDPQEEPNVHLKLKNIPDDHYFVDDEVPYGGGYFIYDTNLEIADSGEWQIEVQASDSDDNTDTETIKWNVPWGSLDSYLISPATDITVPKSGSFTVEVGVECLDAECPDVSIALLLNEPVELKYDDATPENYGDIGSTAGYIAVRFTPSSYPAQLKTARFYVWDETTYPFELRVWDDDGYDWLGFGGAPGTALVTPFVVDPVVTSSAGEVAWFDVDLSAYDIVINSGDFYIGWRQLEGTANNQVGFDTNGTRYTRTWGYLPAEPPFWPGGWFNLDDWCWFDSQYCGNIMIRAIMGEPGSYSGRLPRTVGPAIFYTLDEHPKPCPDSDMDAGETCEVAFNVYAVGPVDEYANFRAGASNNYSCDSAGPRTVTITDAESLCHAANLNAVGLVEFHDFAVLANEWLQSTGPLLADIDDNESVDALDLSIMSDYWLQDCQ